MEIKTVDQIYNDMKHYIIGHQKRLTDFNEGSVLNSQAEAISREIGELYISCFVGFSSFLRELPYSVFGFKLKEGNKASVNVVFSREKASDKRVTIEPGTRVSGNGLNFETTVPGVIQEGAISSNPVLASAEKVGEKYNVDRDTIKTILHTASKEVVDVNNPDAAVGGTSTEDWAAYMTRFTDYILGLGRTNLSGIKTALKECTRSVAIEEHFPPLKDTWNMTLYMEDGSGGMTPKGLAEAENIINGNLEKEIEGYRVPGIKIRCTTPEIVSIRTEVTVTPEGDAIHSAVTKAVVDEVQKYVNRRLIGESLHNCDLIVALKRLPNVQCVEEITFQRRNDEWEFSEPEKDIELKHNQIARYEGCKATVET